MARCPVVGVTLSLDPGTRIRPGLPYVYLNRSYLQQLSSAGASPVAVGPDISARECASLCAGLVVSGGGDLPCSFSAADIERFAPAGEAEDSERVAWERELLAEFVARGKPVLGVCYGMQLVCLHFGGRLVRDLNELGFEHGNSQEPTRHSVTADGPSALLAELGPRFETNSTHRQAVEHLPAGFRVTARAEDGVVEAIENADASISGVQWHPESDLTGEAVYGRFVAPMREHSSHSCANNRAQRETTRNISKRRKPR